MKKKYVLLGFLVICSILSGCTVDNDTNHLDATFTVEPETISINTTVFFNSTHVKNHEIENVTWKINNNIFSYVPSAHYHFSEVGEFIISLTITDIEGVEYTNQHTISVIDPGNYEKHILGFWQWTTDDQLGNWTFYENNTLKSVFTGIRPTGEYGSSVTHYWRYEITETELIFTEPSDERLDEGNYSYEFHENASILRISIDENRTADWYKIS